MVEMRVGQEELLFFSFFFVAFLCFIIERDREEGLGDGGEDRGEEPRAGREPGPPRSGLSP